MTEKGLFSIQQALKALSKQSHLSKYKVGLEKESLRIDQDLTLSSKPHPLFLGSPLFNSFFTLDFANAQLEWTTPPKASFSAALRFLQQSEAWSLNHSSDEAVTAFWPFSMPMQSLEAIALADFGSSSQALQKKLYRQGLCHRYGRQVQTICGVHLNLSFPRSLFQALYQQTPMKESLDDFITSSYFHICRNYLRFGWFITYLFGASPFSLEKLPSTKPFHGTFLMEHSTSLRMSTLGYYSRIQEQMGISYNSLNEYLHDMNHYLNKKRDTYTQMLYDELGNKRMMNDAYLQIPNEHYARIRPKSENAQFTKGTLNIQNIDYLEIRSLDLNPLTPLSIDKQTCQFVHLFLLMCLFHPSPPLSQEHIKQLTDKQNLVALQGRDRRKILCKTNNITIADEALRLCKLLDPIAIALDSELGSSHYKNTLSFAKLASNNAEKTYSGALVKALEKHQDFSSFTKNLTKEQSQFFTTKQVPPATVQLFEKEAVLSLKKQTREESTSHALLEGYETLELSTQTLIRAAQKANINARIIDEETNLIELTQGSLSVIVQQATISHADSYLTYNMMRDKRLTKKMLQRAGIDVPPGSTFKDKAQALNSYTLFSDRDCIVKPVHTNYGLGIHFIKQGALRAFETAIHACFKLDTHVMAESWIKGREYRFLVIDGEVNSVIYREPANVIGDGLSSIKQLVAQKNSDPHYYREPYLIKLLFEEQDFLAKQSGLDPSSIPASEKKIYLRGNSNISTGGDPIDVTDSIPTYFSNIAVQAAASCNACFCGVDMIIPELDKETYSIIELNYNPAIFFHDRPFKGNLNGPKRDPGSAILKSLGFHLNIDR